MLRSQVWFGDLTRFAAFVIFWQGLASSGYGQTQNGPPRSVAPLPVQPAALVNPIPADLPHSPAPSRPRNEATPAPPGAKPGGKSVKASRFAPATASADNPADPYIVAQAQALGDNPAQIFAFVRDQIGFQAYRGSLRGARGTLWSRSGNSLDRASLLVALLGAAGQSARYVQGSLPVAQQKQLILSMFPSVYQVSGCPLPGSTRSDPANDPNLLAIVSDHYWVEFGAGNTPADPSFPTSTVGSVLGTPVNRFTAIPANLQHTVAFRLDIEVYQQASALLGAGNGISTSEVLNQTFATTDLVGVSVTLGHLVDATTASSVFSASTFTYSPYLRIGADPTNPVADQIIRGQDYQEVYTNFPLGTQVLTGVFLRMDVNDPGAATQTYERVLLDRIGYAARQTGAAVSVGSSGSPQPALTALNLVTVNAASSALSPGYVNAYQNAAAGLDAQRASAAAAVQAAGSGVNDQSVAAFQQATNSVRDIVTQLGAATTSKFVSLSDQAAQTDAQAFDVVSYPGSPRLIAFALTLGGDLQNGPATFSFAMDLRKDDVTTIAAPGQAAVATFAFNSHRGLRENQQEAGLMSQLTSSLPGRPAAQPFYILQLFAAAQSQSIPSQLIDSTNVGTVSSMPLGADAQARITAAVSAGRVVITPAAPVQLNGAPRVAWLEIDPATGQVQDTTPDGGHQALVQYVAVSAVAHALAFAVLNPNSGFGQFVIGFVAGFLVGAVLAALLLVAVFNLPGGLALSNAQLFLASIFSIPAFGNILAGLTNATPAFKAGFLIGLLAGVAAVFLVPLHRPGAPVTEPAMEPLISLATGSGLNIELPIATAANGPSGLSGPSLTLAALGEAFNNGPTLPLAFTAVFPNSTGSPQTFTIDGPAPAGFTLIPSLPSITVPPGKSGQVDVCVAPAGALPAPGTTESVSLTSPQSVSANFTVSAVQSVGLSASPSALAAAPGQPITTRLTIQNTGNVNATATLSGSATPGLSFGGLTSPVTLAPGQSTNQTLTLTPFGTVGSQLSLSVTSSTGVGGGQTFTVQIPVNLTSAQAEAALSGASSAAALGRTDIAATLSGLANAINTALSACSPAAQSQLLANIDNLIQEMNAPFLAGFVAPLQSARAAVAGSACGNLAGALTQLSSTLSDLANALNSPAAFPFSVQLLPNSALAIPGQSAQFGIAIQNRSTTTNTYTLTLGQLPSGASGSLSATSVTLGPGQAATPPNGPTVTITTGSGLAFPFSVTAAISGVPGSAQTAYGSLTARTSFLSVVDVKATPGFTASGGSVDVVTHIANVVNTNRTVQVALAIKDAGGNTVATAPTQTVQLSVASLITTVDFGMVSTTGLANGYYSLVVTIIDPATNQPIPGGSGTGSLLVGSPVSATLTVNPTTLAPGNGTVTSTLNVSLTGLNSGALSLVGSVPVQGGGFVAIPKTNVAYLCGQNAISIIDTSNPASPQALSSFGSADLGGNGGNCYLYQNTKLIELTGPAGDFHLMSIYDISNPTSPVKLAGPTQFSPPGIDPFIGDIAFNGNTAYLTTNWFRYFICCNSIFEQHGDFFDYDFSDPTNPVFLSRMPGDQDSPHFFASLPNATTAYFGSTSATGGMTNGQGKVDIVDISNPANLTLLKQVTVPEASWVLSLGLQGNLALGAGNTQGWCNGCSDFNLRGNLTLTAFDITDPRNPTVISTLVTGLQTIGVGSVVSLGGGRFALAIQPSENNLGGPGQLLLIDASDPANLTISASTNVPGLQNPARIALAGGLIYAPTSAGLNIYQAGGGGGTFQYTATVRIANNSGVFYNSRTFSVTPTSITAGAGFDTVTWVNPPARTITWMSNVTGIQPGQVLPVDLGATVNFASPIGSGSLTLPQADVTSEQILALSPGTQTTGPGTAVTYTLTVKNPASLPATYNLIVTGVAPGWVTLQNTVTVPGGGQVAVPLTLRSELTAPAGTYSFTVIAGGSGPSGSVQGSLVLQGSGSVGPVTGATVSAVSTGLSPSSATAGQGTPATYTIRVTNAGSTADTYSLSVTIPGNIAVNLSQSTLQVPPGVTNFRQANLTLRPLPGSPAGPVNFTVTATSTTNPAAASSAPGVLNVAAAGVRVSLNPPSGPPGPFTVTVTNTGTSADVFDLSLGGPAAAGAALGANSVTLGPGASQNVPVTFASTLNFTAGAVALVAQAVSRSNNAVRAGATAQVTIAPHRGVTAEFSSSNLAALSSPGNAPLLLTVHNTGTVEDSYSATITSVTGPASASLVGLDGAATQTISRFILPALSQGDLHLNVMVTGAGQTSVTVTIQSLTDPAVNATATTGPIAAKPVSSAGRGQNVLVNAFTFLDGSGSVDPGGNHLTYRWSIVSVPIYSKFLNSDLRGLNTPRPFFRPDAVGQYVFQLLVNNGVSDSPPARVTINAYNSPVPPTANAGKPVNALRGGTATVDGSLSHAGQPVHPNQPGPLNYHWTAKQVPAGSSVSSASISGAGLAVASFTPDVTGPYVLTLTVSDAYGSASDDVTVTASDPNVAPNAVAGRDRRVLPGQSVALDGTRSNDPDNGPRPLTYLWRFASGVLPDSAINGSINPSANFLPTQPGFYVVRLDASDSVAVSSDLVTITVANACDANADGVIDRADLDLMSVLIGQPAPANDPLDVDHDGVITDNDVNACSARQGVARFVATPGPTPDVRESAMAATLVAAPLAVTAVKNAASLFDGPVAPGELVVITGSGFGGRFAATGRDRLPEELDGIRVLFDGIAAPLLYVAPDQVGAVVPQGVAGARATAVEAVRGAERSNRVTVPVADAAPGVYPLAFNEDGSVNSDSNPAHPGSIVRIFVTGAGLSSAALAAFAGDRHVEIVGMRQATDLVNGLLEVNVRVPPEASDATLPVRVVSGGAQSQPGVAISLGPR